MNQHELRRQPTTDPMAVQVYRNQKAPSNHDTEWYSASSFSLRQYQFLYADVPVAIAIAEGEGDCSLETWRKLHRWFFEPYLDDLGIDDLDKAEVVTEFFEVVYSKDSVSAVSPQEA